MNREEHLAAQKALKEHNRKKRTNRAIWAAVGGIAAVSWLGLDLALNHNETQQSQNVNHFTPVSPATPTTEQLTTTPPTTTEVTTTMPTTTETTTTTPAVDTVRQNAVAMLGQYTDCKPYFTSSGPNTLATFTPGFRIDDNAKALRAANAGNTTYQLHPAEYTLQGVDAAGNTVSLPQGGSYSPDSPATVHLQGGAGAPKKYQIVVTETLGVNDPARSPYSLVGNFTCAQDIELINGTWRPADLDQASGPWNVTER